MQGQLEASQQPYAVVIGLDGINGLQTARILASRGVPVIAIARDPGHYGCRTNCCKKILFADTKSNEFVATLATLGPQFSQKAVLFPCEDMGVLHISRNRQMLAQWYHIALPAPETVEMLIDKMAFYDFARREGLPIPRTETLHNLEDATRAARELRFPCILKPSKSSTTAWEHNNKFKAYRVSSADEFLALYQRCAAWSDVLVVQEWIEGPESNLYSCNCYLDANSRPVVTFVARKLRQWPPDVGESCLGEECRDDVVLNTTISLFQRARHCGLGYVEMKRDERSGNYFIIEPNIGRPTGRSAIAEAGGVELVYTMYCDCVGWPLPRQLEQKYTGVKWIYLRRDVQSALHRWRQGELTPRAWWQSIRGRKTDAVFSWRDPAPFVFDLIRAVRLYSSPEERSRRDYRTAA